MKLKAILKIRGRRIPKLPKQRQPDGIRRQYYKDILKLLEATQAKVRDILVPGIEALVEQASKVATYDTLNVDAEKGVGELIDELEDATKDIWARKKLATLARKIGKATDKKQAMELNRQMRALVGIDVVGSEPWIGKAVEEFTSENVALIKSINTRHFNELETSLSRDIADGVRYTEILKKIEERYDVSKSRARLIARDQVGKFNGDLNRVRQQDLGLDSYIWNTMQDKHVRDEHRDLNGKSFKWSDPPPEGHPGEPIQCRCYAEPDLSKLLEE